VEIQRRLDYIKLRELEIQQLQSELEEKKAEASATKNHDIINDEFPEQPIRCESPKTTKKPSLMSTTRLSSQRLSQPRLIGFARKPSVPSHIVRTSKPSMSSRKVSASPGKLATLKPRMSFAETMPTPVQSRTAPPKSAKVPRKRVASSVAEPAIIQDSSSDANPEVHHASGSMKQVPFQRLPH
jgi:hypothetical protein